MRIDREKQSDRYYKTNGGKTDVCVFNESHLWKKDHKIRSG